MVNVYLNKIAENFRKKSVAIHWMTWYIIKVAAETLNGANENLIFEN